MRTRTITVSEYAELYGCSMTFVTRKLRQDTGLTGMVGWKKSGGTWIITVLEYWYKSKQWKCDVCGSRNVIHSNEYGLNCNDCNLL